MRHVWKRQRQRWSESVIERMMDFIILYRIRSATLPIEKWWTLYPSSTESRTRSTYRHNEYHPCDLLSSLALRIVLSSVYDCMHIKSKRKPRPCSAEQRPVLDCSFAGAHSARLQCIRYSCWRHMGFMRLETVCDCMQERDTHTHTLLHSNVFVCIRILRQHAYTHSPPKKVTALWMCRIVYMKYVRLIRSSQTTKRTTHTSRWTRERVL